LHLGPTFRDSLQSLGLLHGIDPKSGHDPANLDELPGAVLSGLYLYLLGQKALLSLQLPDPCLGVSHSLF
jgi:hypothetical protein